MIKFFKSIRQELVMKNDTSKYFKYAIGEVVLVMVGILLALQVNNWNNTRAKKQLEKTVLLQLKEDLGSMLNDLRGDKDVLKVTLTSSNISTKILSIMIRCVLISIGLLETNICIL